ncbi:MAG: 2-C-methyl-D-erythritol 2,4-cyclodiphosphate synthase, partial [Clostridia bacterium]|nr:2-C-methyl-D-erythritol 2,4-cyclodiphosphate synthase [Clostridia bacterium]
STNEYVLIHDGARPFVSKELINLICEETIKHNSAIPYTKPTDTLYNLSNNPKYEDRTNFALIQTPQGFNRTEILEAYNHNNNTSLTDDSSIYLNCKNTINFVVGELSNKKITTIEDLIGLNNKVGIGFDVHRLVENGKPLKLGGINIEYSLGIEAHSDGDVLLHSLSDAILSCAHEKDIGHAFPDNSDKTLDMDSSKILAYALNKLNEKNMIINNISIVIIAQKPKMAKYIDSIIDNLSNLCKLDKNSISITATTTENLGILKDGKAICVLSTITCI